MKRSQEGIANVTIILVQNTKDSYVQGTVYANARNAYAILIGQVRFVTVLWMTSHADRKLTPRSALGEETVSAEFAIAITLKTSGTQENTVKLVW